MRKQKHITERQMLQATKGKDIWLSDPAAFGAGVLCARITPGGKRGFYYRYARSDGKRERLAIGAFDRDGKNGGLSLTEAREKAGELSRLYLSGIRDLREHLEAERRLVDAEKAAEQARLEAERRAAEAAARRMTVQDLFDKWSAAQLSRRKDGGAEVTRSFKKDVLPAIGTLFADEIKKMHISDIVEGILARGANRHAKIVFSSLRQMFGYALYRDWLDIDPTAKIRKADIGTRDVERDRVLGDDEIRLLAKQMPKTGLLPTTEAAIWICLSTCCRIGELLGARWEHIDFEKKTWLIPAENAKNGTAMEVSLSEFSLKWFRVIAAHHHGTPWAYPGRPDKKTGEIGAVCSKTITKQLSDRQRTEAMSNRSASVGALLLPGGKWSPHDLRRTGATLMAILGVAPQVIEKCLNHTEQNRVQRTYQRYSYAAEMAHAWRLLGERLESLTAAKETATITPLHRAG